MSDDSFLIYQLIKKDPRYPIEAYWFVRESLAYAADSMELESEIYTDQDSSNVDAHLTGQQLCEAIRRYALQQYGYLAKIVLNNWNVDSTSCFGDIVYNMISIGLMKKSSRDKRSHFDDVYSFDAVFENNFEICDSMAQRRT